MSTVAITPPVVRFVTVTRSVQGPDAPVLPALRSSQLNTTLVPARRPVPGATARLKGWKSGYGACVEVTETSAPLFDSPVPSAFASATSLKTSVATVAVIVPAPGGPSGSVNVYWRVREPPAP